MTRFVVFVAIPNRKADTVVRALGRHWISHRLGAPVVFVSDNAPEFTAIEEETTAHLEQKLGVKHVYVSSYSPASNLVERVHQQLGRALRIFVEPSRLVLLEGPPRGQGRRVTGRPSPPRSRR